jgi:hypothetical protein
MIPNIPRNKIVTNSFSVFDFFHDGNFKMLVVVIYNFNLLISVIQLYQNIECHLGNPHLYGQYLINRFDS